MRPERIRQPAQLVVEGKDAYNFFGAFIENLELVDIQVQNFGGVTDLSGFLDAFVKAPGFEAVSSIGIVRDAERRAEDDPPVEARPSPASSAFRSVQSSLRRFGLPVPERPMERAGKVRTVSVFILPGDAGDGMLETLLGRTFAGTDVDRCIGRFLQCTADSGNPVQRPEKARVHAYLSTMPHPHVSVGVAAQRGYWDFDHEAFDGVRRFLMVLAQDQPAA